MSLNKLQLESILFHIPLITVIIELIMSGAL
jgi:hypothetical protein